VAARRAVRSARARRERTRAQVAVVRAVPQRPRGRAATAAARAHAAGRSSGASRVRRRAMTRDRSAAGLFWEDAASAYLERHGVETLLKRYRCRLGEL